MTLETHTERKQFIRAVNLNDVQAATRLVCNPNLTDIAQWVESDLRYCDSIEMLDCLLSHYSVSDEALSEALISAARKNNLEMVENLLGRGAKDIRSEAMAFAIVHRNKDIALLIAPVSNLIPFSTEAMDLIGREFFDAVASEHLRHKLSTEIAAHTHTHRLAKKM